MLQYKIKILKKKDIKAKEKGRIKKKKIQVYNSEFGRI